MNDVTLEKFLNFSGLIASHLFGALYMLFPLPPLLMLLLPPHFCTGPPSLLLLLWDSLSGLLLPPGSSPCPPDTALDAPSQRSHSQGFPVIAVPPYIIISCLLDPLSETGHLTYIPSAGHGARMKKMLER